jgi:hypothetical protein
MSNSIKVGLAAAGSVAAIAVFLVLWAVLMHYSFVTIDNFHGAHGLSIGANSAYCSIEFGQLPTCEVAP